MFLYVFMLLVWTGLNGSNLQILASEDRRITPIISREYPPLGFDGQMW